MSDTVFDIKILCDGADAKPEITNGELLKFEKTGGGYVAKVCCRSFRGSCDCVLTLRYGDSGFSFKPADVRAEYPIYAPYLGVAVTEQSDGRNYEEIAAYIKSFGLLTDRERFGQEPQLTLAAAKKYPARPCNTFLAVPGNLCIWNVGFRGEPIEEKQHFELYDWIVPRLNWDRIDFDSDAPRITYRYLLGRGMGFRHRLRRRNRKGFLPALQASFTENGVRYEGCFFCDSVEKDIAEDKGTPYLVADYHSAAHAITEEQDAEREKAEKRIVPTVLRAKISAVNTASTGRYAYFRLPDVNTPVMSESNKLPVKIENGTGYYRNNVYMLASTDGEPSAAQEFSIMLAPGERTETELVLFHSPVSVERAKEFSTSRFSERLEAAEKYWRFRLGSLEKWHLPEKCIDEALKTGYFHLLESCYGERGSNVFSPCVGVYSAIGWESSNVIRFLTAVGDFETARKSMNFFFAKQHPDGFMQNMTGYMLENGAVLYTAAKHYECTRDTAWLASCRDGIIKSVEYIKRWRERNSDERGGGKGMLDGQVADPADPFRSYMLNALAYAGLMGAAEMLRALSDDYACEAEALANELKASVLAAFKESCTRAPLAPLKNGEWVPAVPSWAEGRGASALHLNGEICVTHASHIVKDSLLSVAYLPYMGVFDCEAEQSRVIINYIADMFLDENTGYSQPYYSPIPFLNLWRGETNAFLREYYTAFATLADRETYSFWEHYFLATPHKTSEQACFLMRTLSMLFYDKDGELFLLHGVPDSWQKAGKRIEWHNAACSFGRFSLLARYGSHAEITVESEFDCPAAYVKCFGKSRRIDLRKGKNLFVFTE